MGNETRIGILTEVVQEAHDKLTIMQGDYSDAKKIADKALKGKMLTSEEVAQFGELLNRYRNSFANHPEYTKRFVEERGTTAEQFIDDMIAYANKHPGEDYATFTRFLPRATSVIIDRKSVV